MSAVTERLVKLPQMSAQLNLVIQKPRTLAIFSVAAEAEAEAEAAEAEAEGEAEAETEAETETGAEAEGEAEGATTDGATTEVSSSAGGGPRKPPTCCPRPIWTSALKPPHKRPRALCG